MHPKWFFWRMVMQQWFILYGLLKIVVQFWLKLIYFRSFLLEQRLQNDMCVCIWLPKWYRGGLVNSLWPSDAIWQQGSRSTVVQVVACCLTAPSHYLNQCWLSSLRSSYVHLRAILLEISQQSVTKISLKIIFLRFYWNLPGANELTCIESKWYIYASIN